MVAAIASPFLFTSGMPHETAFPHMSDLAGSGWRGFLYLADPSRIHTTTFYHLAHVAAEWAGAPGSFASYQIVYAILWWARGMLVFAILRRLFPGQLVFAYAAGALCLAHASDYAYLWVGQMNHQGFLFWMLLAFYFFVTAIRTPTLARAGVCIAMAGAFAYMALWSYESPLPLVLAFPALVLAMHRPIARRAWLLAAAWYVVPAKYVSVLASRYFASGQSTYQSGVMRRDWTSWPGDWIYNIAASLRMGSVPDWPSDVTRPHALLLALGAAAVFALGGAVVYRLAGRRSPDPAVARKALAGCAVLLILSFPVYLFLADARGLWRTQMLSAPAAAGVVCAAMVLVCARLPLRAGRPVFWVAATAIVCFGAFSAAWRGGYHLNEWTAHRRTMAAIVRSAPQVRPRTMFVLLNVPRNGDPFDANDWFDSALRLAYPGTPVAGVYYHAGLSPAPNVNQRLDNNAWKWDGRPLAPLVADARLEETIVMEYLADGVVRIVPELPPSVCASCAPERYQPLERITGAHAAVKAVNRYGPL